MHSRNLAPQLGSLRVELGKGHGALLGNVGEPLLESLGDIGVCVFASSPGR
jgi:hypothetical protein